MNVETRTHENKDAIGIFLPVLDHLVVFVICSLGVYGEERPGAVTEIGFSFQWVIWRRLRVRAFIYYSMSVKRFWG
jgi:hypothetical protein